MSASSYFSDNHPASPSKARSHSYSRSISVTGVCSMLQASYIIIKQIPIITNMKISQLCQNRLQISINSLKTSPGIPECLSQTLSQIFEYLQENATNIQYVESELISKVSSSEMNFALSQKLSMPEFLEYFGKVEKIIDSMDRNQRNQYYKFNQSLEEHSNRIGKMDQIVETVLRDWERKKKSQELEQETVRAQIKQLRKKIEYTKTGEKPEYSNSIDVGKISEEFRDLEQCCLQMKANLDQLVQDFQFRLGECKRTTHYPENKFVTFDELREVLLELQRNLTTSISNYLEHRPITSMNLDSQSMIGSRLNWHNTEHNPNEIMLTPTFKPGQNSRSLPMMSASCSVSHLTVKWSSQLSKHWQGKPMYEVRFISTSQMERKSGTVSPSYSTNPCSLSSSQIRCVDNLSTIFELRNQHILIKEMGFYQIKCGFLPYLPTQLMLFLNQEVIASHSFNEPPPKSICRAIMMYVQVDQGAEIRLRCCPLDEQWKSGSKRKPLQGVQNMDYNSLSNETELNVGFLSVERLA